MLAFNQEGVRLMELYPIRELQTEAGKRMADHLSDLGVKDSSMAFYIGEGGEEVVSVTAGVYKRLASRVGIHDVFAVAE